jgi:TolB-like protein/tetratricopeptide (TPR) repeat protein
MPFDLENLGEQELKGFDDTVRVYRVELSAGESVPFVQRVRISKTSSSRPRLMVVAIVIALVVVGNAAYWFKTQEPKEEPASVERMAYPLPDKPSIAVLPFTNMSNDVEQEFFADGMTEDLITDISKVSGLFVIARNSVFTYKGKAVQVRQVAEELGVRYVLEGSVRRVGNQVRINAQLIDATTGGHIWAERYDGSLDDVFAMQDKITGLIVVALSVTLTGQELGSLAKETETSNPEAYDAFLQGWKHFKLETPEDFASARDYFERAITIDPNYSRAFAALAALYWETRNREWSPALGIGQMLLRQGAIDYLAKPGAQATVIGLMTSSKIHLKFGKDQEAIHAAEQAIQIAPNNAEAKGNLAEVLIYSGLPDRALTHIVEAMRLDPLHQAYLFYLRGLAEFGLERYENASVYLKKALKLNPDYRRPAAILAATYIFLDRPEEAAIALEDYLSEYDGWWANVPSMMTMFFPYKHENDRLRLSEGLYRAGVPGYSSW